MAEKIVKRRIESYYIGGKNLKVQRLAAGISQKKMAEQLSVFTGQEFNQRRISEWENSFEFPVNRITLVALKRILKIT